VDSAALNSGDNALQLPEPPVRNAPWRVRSSLLATTVLLASTALGTISAHAIDGTWIGGGGVPNEWVEGDNWSSNPVVPDGTATFTNNGAPTTVQANGIVDLSAITFTAAPNNAPAYTITMNDIFIVTGAGVSNNSTNTQTFNVTSITLFENSSSASGGTAAVTYNNSANMLFFNTSTAGNAIIANNSDLEFNDSSNAGTAQIINNATLNFNNTSSASGSTITNNAGQIVNFFNTSSAGTATLNNSGTLNFNNSTTASGANITGATGSATNFNSNATAGGSVITLQGTGTLAFNNSSTAAGATINSALVGGSITFNDTSTAANANIVLKESNLVFNNSASAGSATITMPDANHPGTITFNDTTTAANSNITVIGSLGVGGSLNFLNSSTAGNATLTTVAGIGAGGQVLFGSLGGTDTSDAGTAHILNNGGTTSFLAHTSAKNATITNGNTTTGSTSFQDQSTAANATIINNNGGTTIFGVAIVGTDTATAANANITNRAGGTTEFVAATTAGNATITNQIGGFLQFGDSGAGASTATAGNSTINNSGNVSFNALTTAGSAVITTNSGANVFFFDSSTGGNAQFTTNAGGFFDMSGLTATGMTAGSIAGAGSYVLGGKSLTVGSNNLSTSVSGVISGVGGSLTKVGSGTLTLSGINTYTGATNVNGGKLEVDGSTAASSLTTVNAGGTLFGIGTVGATNVAGGVFAPGNAANPFSPFTVQGNLSFTAASTYMIQVSPANAGHTSVNGSATLGGATVSVAFTPGSYTQRTYNILSATGGVSGTFNPTIVSNMSALGGTLSYDANDVFLNVKLNFAVPGGLNVNQQNVANALTNFFNSNGGIPSVFAMLTPAGLTQASGELSTASQQTTFDAMGKFLGLLTDPFGGGNPTSTSAGAIPYVSEQALSYSAARSTGERNAYAAMYTKAPPASVYEPRWSVWAAGYGGSQTTDGNAALGSNNMGSQIFATAVGADYRFSPNTVAGFALAGGGTNFNVANSGFGRSDLFQAGAYIKHHEGNAYINAALAYGWQDITTDRTVNIAGFDRLHAEFNANAYAGRVEGGYRFATPWMGITPYAAGQFTTFDLPAYAEQVLAGGGNFPLAYGAKSVTDPRSELGVRADKSFAMTDGVLTLRGRVAWAHDFDPNRVAAATFQTLPGASFVVNGAAQAHDSALTTASAEMKWLSGWSAGAAFEGEFSSVTRSYGGKAVVRYTW